MIFKKKEELKTASLTPEYWNDKWPKAPIIYSGRALKTKSDRINIDVKTFITPHDEILINILNKYKLIKSDPDATMWEIQKWVVRFLRYVEDEKTAAVPEYWMFPFETVQAGIGDCEDGGILTAALAINAGIPSYRVKVAAGYVQEAPTAPQGGHAYCIYLASDDAWRICDWCYFEDSKTPILKKPLAKDGGQNNAYKDVWFTFNNEFSWNQKALAVNGRVSVTSGDKVIDTEAKLTNLMKEVDKQYKNRK